MGAAELDTFYTCMRQWKAIGQLAPGRQKCLVPVAKKPSRVLAQVYRYDSAGVRDWGVALDTAIKCLTDRPANRLEIVQRLQVEYLLSSIRNGDTLSIAEATDATLQEARALPLADLPALFGKQPDEATGFSRLWTFKQVAKKHGGQLVKVCGGCATLLRFRT